MSKGKEYKMPSGATLFVGVASYELVMELHDSLGEELRGNGIGILDVGKIQKSIDSAKKKRMTLSAGKPWEDEEEGDDGLNGVVDKILALASSRKVKAALFACAESAVYRQDGTESSSIQFKVGAPGYGVFDNPLCMDKAREDFYDICKGIAEENLRPFGKALLSMFMAHMGNSASTQKSSSVTG